MTHRGKDHHSLDDIYRALGRTPAKGKGKGKKGGKGKDKKGKRQSEAQSGSELLG